jgi:hypothetical protein
MRGTAWSASGSQQARPGPGAAAYPGACGGAVCSRRASARVAAAGSPASVIARTTTTSVAPAARTSLSRPRSMPPIANQGRAGDAVAHGPAGLGAGEGPAHARHRLRAAPVP